MDCLIEQLGREILTGDVPERAKLSGRVTDDSRKVSEGDIFVAVRGPMVDGHEFVDDAKRAGAALILVERGIGDEAAQRVGAIARTVADSKNSLGKLAWACQNRPDVKLKLFGVTGTNGKTTVATMLKWILDYNGVCSGFVGTVGYDVGDGLKPLENTTPGSVQLAELAAEMVKNGLQAMVMECSSHGLHQKRTAGMEFAAAAYTNLSGDHLDYHGDMESYRDCKAMLFDHLVDNGVAVINNDDEHAYHMIKACGDHEVITFGLQRNDADLEAHIKEMDMRGCEVELHYLGQKYKVKMPVVARHNVSNFLAAAGMALGGGLNMKGILQAMKEFPGVPGRLSAVDCGQDFGVFVDYAHTDDALERVLATVKELAAGRVILVFGCGGDRDRSKRPRMAKAAQKYADVIFVTNDNPRTEDPQQIIADCIAGFDSGVEYSILPDRAEAIYAAIGAAGEGDVVLIAGKGHEDYQIIGTEKVHFDDREIAEKSIEKRQKAEGSGQ